MQLKIVAQNNRKLFVTKCVLLLLINQIDALWCFVLFSRVFHDVLADHTALVDFDYADMIVAVIVSTSKTRVVLVHSFHGVVIFTPCALHLRLIDGSISILHHVLL